MSDWSEAEERARRVLARTMDDDAHEVAGDFLAFKAECDADHPPEPEYTAWCEAGKPDGRRIKELEEERDYYAGHLKEARDATERMATQRKESDEERDRLKAEVRCLQATRTKQTKELEVCLLEALAALDMPYHSNPDAVIDKARELLGGDDD